MTFSEALFGGAVLYFLYKATSYLKQLASRSGSRVKVTGEESDHEKQQKISQLLECLRSSEVKKRRMAAIAFGALSELGWDVTNALPDLEQTLTDADVEVRRQTVLSLGKIGTFSHAALMQLNSLAKDPNESIRRAVMCTFLGLRRAETIPAIADALSDPVKKVRTLALMALQDLPHGEIGKVLPQLIELLRDRDEFIVDQSIAALGKIGAAAKECVPELLRLWKKSEDKFGLGIASALGQGLGAGAECFIPIFAERLVQNTRPYEASRLLGSIGEAAIPALIEALKKDEPNKSIKWHASSALKHIGKKALKPLISELQIEQGSAREKILYAIDYMGMWNEALRKPLISLAVDPDPKVAAASLKCLSSLAPTPLPDDVRPTFVGCLSSPEGIVREAALFVLLSHFPHESFEAFKRLLDDEIPEVRAAAVRGVGVTHSEETVSLLSRLLGDEDEAVRVAVAKSLSELNEELAVDVLIRLLRQDDGGATTVAFEALSKMESSAARKAAKEYQQRSLIPKLIETLETDSSDYQRKSAARNLGELKAKQAAPALLKALDSENSDLRETALRSLTDLGSISAEESARLIRIYRNTDYTYFRPELLKAMGDLKIKEAIPICVAALREEWMELRNGAAIALRNFGEEAKTAAPQLIKNMKTDDYYEASIGTLMSIGDASIPSLTQAMKSRDTIIKAAYALSEIHTPLALDALISYLSEIVSLIESADEKETKRLAQVVKRLGRYAGDAVIRLNRKVKFEDVSLYGTCRVTIAEALLQLDTEESTSQALFLLGQALHSDDSWARLCAVEKLEELGTKEAREVLSNNLVHKLILDLDDPYPFCERTKFEAANQLRRLGNKKGNEALKGFSEKHLTQLVAELESGIVKPVIFELSSIKGVGCLGNNAVRALPALRKLLQEFHDDESTTNDILEAIVRIRERNAINEVVPILKEKLADGNYHLARLFPEIVEFDEDVISTLVSALSRSKEDVSPVVDALAEIGSDCIPVLVDKVLLNSDPESHNASKALLEIRGDALPLLLSRMNEENSADLLVETALSLGLKAECDYSAIVSRLDDTVAVRRHIAAAVIAGAANFEKVVVDIEFDKVASILEEALGSTSSLVRAYAYDRVGIYPSSKALTLLASGLNDEDLNVRSVVLQRLACYGNEAKETIPVLSEIVSKRTQRLASLAARALRAIGTWEAMQLLKAYADDRVPQLLEAVSSTNEEVCREAIEELIRIGDAREEVVDALSGVVKSNRPIGLRKQAIAALVQVSPDLAYEPVKSIPFSISDSGLYDCASDACKKIAAIQVARHLERYASKAASSE